MILGALSWLASSGMLSILFGIAVAAALLALTIVVGTLFTEVLSARSAPRSLLESPSAPIPPVVAVLVPAHNESIGAIPTLSDAKTQLRSDDRLLVVADNCDDDTADVARAQGVEVLERRDLSRRGKGYALSAGVAYLGANPPDVVVVVDADCRLAPRAIERLAATCASKRRPAQANYIMTAPANAAVSYNVAEFAWRIKNFVRPLGLLALGLPCQLTGSGMAFPWASISSAQLATGNIVEDMALGVELAIRGEPPIFCPSAIVTSPFPTSTKGLETQRRRWEQGHFQTIAASAGPLLLKGLSNRSFAQIGLALDLAVPPLTVLLLMTLSILVFSIVIAWIGFSSTPFYVACADALVLVGAVALAWLDHGREILPVSAFPKLAPYLMGKLRIYQSILRAKGPARWTPTDRK